MHLDLAYDDLVQISDFEFFFRLVVIFLSHLREVLLRHVFETCNAPFTKLDYGGAVHKMRGVSELC